MKNHPFENKYCGPCQCTTRHEVKRPTFSCLRCGSVKFSAKNAVRQNAVVMVTDLTKNAVA